MPEPVKQEPAKTFHRGARPTPRFRLASAVPYVPYRTPPSQYAIVPAKLSMWGNDQYGDCVTAEEAFKCACDQPEDFVSDDTVIQWATKNGFRDGADLLSVMQQMQRKGFPESRGGYLNDGAPHAFDYTNQDILKAAISEGTVKIAIDANALPQGAGNHQGWYAFGGGNHPNTDHCVALTGYGPASFCFDQLGVYLPSSVDPAKMCYLLYTWSTIGVVDHAWLVNTCAEAWIRQPSTVHTNPTPPPPPPPQPPPPQPPGPGPGPCNLPIVKGMIALLSWIDTLPLPLPAWIDAMLSQIVALLKVLCPQSLKDRHHA